MAVKFFTEAQTVLSLGLAIIDFFYSDFQKGIVAYYLHLVNKLFKIPKNETKSFFLEFFFKEKSVSF